MSETGRAGSAAAGAAGHATRCRALCAAQRYGTLSTLARDPAGYPYGSLAQYALDERGQPLFLLSGLAEHTANLRADARASLLVCEQPPAGKRAGGRLEADRLALGRATLLGQVQPVATEEVDGARRRFLERHPAAERYLQLPDFAFYRLTVESARYVGGFGRMSWIDGEEYASGAVE